MQTTNTAQNDNLGNKMIHRVDDASNSMHHAIDRASDAAGPAIDGLATGAHQATNHLAMTATEAAMALRGATEQLRATQQRLAQNCSSYVRQKPLTSLAMAAAGGFLLVMAVRLTHRSPARH
ncbi:MAG: hypothetical protein ABJA49_05525 [Betaproteobacteria bacterium]